MVLVPTVLGVQTTERSEEHTSELQSQSNIVCRLLLEKKKNRIKYTSYPSSATPTCRILSPPNAQQYAASRSSANGSFAITRFDFIQNRTHKPSRSCAR